MRLVTWNCRIGGFRKKSKHIALLEPDVVAVQEVEPIENVLLFAGDCQPTFRDRISDPAYPRRSIGVFSYTGVTLEAVDGANPMYGFRRYRAEHQGRHFQVVAVWTSATKSRKTSYRQAIEGVREHANWIEQAPTVIMGDFNDNASWKGTNWPELQNLLQPLGFVSAYHTHFDEAFGAETRRTYFHRGKEDTSAAHLDYCLIPKDWGPRITKVLVDASSHWRDISDHIPLVVDVDL